MISNISIDKHITFCYSVLCLLALSPEVFTLPAPTLSGSLEVPIASRDPLPPSHFHFCLLHIQVFSFQWIAHSFAQRPSHNPLPINYFRTLFIATEGVPPSFCIPDLAIRHSPLATVFKPFLFKFLRTLLRFFALAKNSTLLFSMNSALCTQNTRGAGYPRYPYLPTYFLTSLLPPVVRASPAPILSARFAEGEEAPC